MECLASANTLSIALGRFGGSYTPPKGIQSLMRSDEQKADPDALGRTWLLLSSHDTDVNSDKYLVARGLLTFRVDIDYQASILQEGIL
jgi:hypothetical protein